MMEETEAIEAEIVSEKDSRLALILMPLVVLMGVVLFIAWLYISPPKNMETTRVEIEPGQSVRGIAEILKEANVIRSESLLYAIITGLHDPTNIYAGSYVFTPGTNVFRVAAKLAANEVESDLTRITLPEGIRLTAMADIAATNLPNFDAAEYLNNTNGLEGYLWPETYFVPDTYTADKLIELQQTTYEEKVAPLREAIEQSALSEAEVIILASIIEREANDETSMKMVSGILQNRLAIDMPLQADATIEYVLDTPLNELPAGQLAAELRETDSPYNTYNQIGLPPTPIGNPGLQAIEAVLYPTASDYFYYLTGIDGNFYYAKTLSEHNRNVELYLRP